MFPVFVTLLRMLRSVFCITKKRPMKVCQELVKQGISAYCPVCFRHGLPSVYSLFLAQKKSFLRFHLCHHDLWQSDVVSIQLSPKTLFITITRCPESWCGKFVGELMGYVLWETYFLYIEAEVCSEKLFFKLVSLAINLRHFFCVLMMSYRSVFAWTKKQIAPTRQDGLI